MHCFAAVWIPDEDEQGCQLPTGKWFNCDAGDEAFMVEEASGETRYADEWTRGPIGAVQSNLDHLLLMRPSQRWALAKDLTKGAGSAGK